MPESVPPTCRTSAACATGYLNEASSAIHRICSSWSSSAARSGASGTAPGRIALVTADGAAREVADGLAFPNGMAVTPDNGTLIVAESFARRLTAFEIGADGSLSNRRVWADVTGEGICIEAQGAVWCSAVGADGGNVVLRVREGGEVLDRIEVDRPCYACMLGGDDGRTRFMVVAQWFGPDRMDELFEAKTGQILTARVAVPHAGWP
jgi:sugar lactone lactonase YvrE